MGCQMNEYDSNRILDLTKKSIIYPLKICPKLIVIF